ncbi:4Fe-4S binding protein [uncultured Holdemanella sp.]
MSTKLHKRFCDSAKHCLHCGLCFETCPVQAIERM